MQTLKLNDNWDLEVDSTGTKLETLTAKNALAQLITQRLLLIRGEFLLDKNKGVDYYSILGVKRIPEDDEFISAIEDLGYGLKVIDFYASFDKNTRQYKLNLKAKSTQGEITL